MTLQNDFIELKDHNLWMGINSENEWVILDRNLPGNKKRITCIGHLSNKVF